MGKIIDINECSWWTTSEVICKNCGHRWIAERPEGTLLKNITCPNCGEHGHVIETGEEIRDE